MSMRSVASATCAVLTLAAPALASGSGPLREGARSVSHQASVTTVLARAGLTDDYAGLAMGLVSTAR
jgi:hypothetical protein